MIEEILTREKLQEVLHYDQDSGQFTWLTTSNRKKAGERAGTTVSHRYRKIQVYNKIYYEHRLAWLYVYGEFPQDVIDHIDGNGLNNKIENLRCVSHSGNMQNQLRPHKNNKLKALGVTQTKNGKFRAQIFHKKIKRLGVFDTVEQASQAYIQAKRELHSTCNL
jgi:HNH endonuclease/AP2 domain